MENDLVDILVTTFNTQPQYLIKQIDSLLSQTYQNIKIYISDDASKDIRIKEILIDYEKKDNRVKIFLQEKNKGFIKNFEFLLNQSKAPYIMFCDHDDIWDKDKVEICLKEIKEKNVDLVYSDVRQIDEEDNVIQKSYLKYKNLPIIEGNNIKKLYARHTILGCSQIITKDVKEKMLPFKKSVIAHDWLSVVIANEKKGISYIPKTLLGYRIHSSNIFGGRNLEQNIKKWKLNNGTSYKDYLNYREDVIKNAYKQGTKMSLDYITNQKNKEEATKILNYFDKISKKKYISFNVYSYFKFLYYKGLKKRMLKEIILFHFPILRLYCI